ncbi:MAG: 50S ribosomal protein L10 [Planctomycetes bacterium]|nr:50S ribosomal protein L10 [Planctomycetota bacterium]
MVSTLNEWMVGTYGEQFSGNEGMVLLSIENLTVEESQELRTKVREAGAQLRVTKNRLAKVALQQAGIEFSDDAWSGMCGIMVGDTESTINATKAIEVLWKKAEVRKVNYRAAVLDGSQMSASEAASIASMEDKDTLRGKICGTIMGSPRQLAAIFSEVPTSLARVIQARVDQGE